jgi:hypothetical protein
VTPYPDAASSGFGVPRSSPPPAAGSSAAAPLDVDVSGSSCAIHYAFDEVVVEDVFHDEDEDEDDATPLPADEAEPPSSGAGSVVPTVAAGVDVGTPAQSPAANNGPSPCIHGAASLSTTATPFYPGCSSQGRSKLRRWTEDCPYDESEEDSPPTPQLQPYVSRRRRAPTVRWSSGRVTHTVAAKSGFGGSAGAGAEGGATTEAEQAGLHAVVLDVCRPISSSDLEFPLTTGIVSLLLTRRI